MTILRCPHHFNDINIHLCPTCDILSCGGWNRGCGDADVALFFTWRGISRWVFHFALQHDTYFIMDGRHGMVAYMEDFPVINQRNQIYSSWLWTFTVVTAISERVLVSNSMTQDISVYGSESNALPWGVMFLGKGPWFSVDVREQTHRKHFV
jgi:hypothetical protein